MAINWKQLGVGLGALATGGTVMTSEIITATNTSRTLENSSITNDVIYDLLMDIKSDIGNPSWSNETIISRLDDIKVVLENNPNSELWNILEEIYKLVGGA